MKKTESESFFLTELVPINKLVYEYYGFDMSDFNSDRESREYYAGSVKIGTRNAIFRKAKVTPGKMGQFVTLWKRSLRGIIRQFDISDHADLYMIAAQQGDHIGIFLFSVTVLLEKGVLSSGFKGGKR